MNKKKIKKFILATSALLGITFVGMKIVAAITKADRNYTKDRKQQNPLEGKKVVFIENHNDSENAFTGLKYEAKYSAIMQRGVTVCMPDEPELSLTLTSSSIP